MADIHASNANSADDDARARKQYFKEFSRHQPLMAAIERGYRQCKLFHLYRRRVACYLIETALKRPNKHLQKAGGGGAHK